MADDLTNQQYLFLVIRLLVDQHGKLQQGILVDPNGETISRFQQLNELSDVIMRWLENWGRQQMKP